MNHQAAPAVAAPAAHLHQGSTAQELKLKGFKAYEVDTTIGPSFAFRQRDFFKVGLVTSHCTVHYADRSIELNGTCLMCANSHISYLIELHEPLLKKYSSLFTEAYLRENDRSESSQQSPLFKVGSTPIFRKMLAEQSTEYLNKAT